MIPIKGYIAGLALDFRDHVCWTATTLELGEKMAATMTFSMIPRRTLAIGFAGAMLLGSAACSDSNEPDVAVGLTEYAVALDPSDPKNGKLEVEVKNDGSEIHEMVIVRAESADALPTDADGAVDEAPIPEADKLGEIEDIEVDKTATKTFDLSAGNYVVFCNVTEEQSDGTVLSHFKEGMYSNLAVS